NLAAINRRHFKFAAKRGARHRDRHTAIQVGAIALEEFVRSDLKKNIKVARPPPPQTLQGSSITCPRPWQVGQVRSSVKNPCAWRILPAPPQLLHGFGLVPTLAPLPEQASQTTEVGIRICAVLPLNASSSVISILYRKSDPRSRPEPRPRADPMPKIPSKISANVEPKSAPNPWPPTPPCSNAA